MTSAAVPLLECEAPATVSLGELLTEILRDLAVPRQRIEGAFLDVGRSLIDASRLLGGISATFEVLAARLEGSEGEGTLGASEALARRVLALVGATNRETHKLGALIAAVALIRQPICALSKAIKSISLVAMETRISAAQLAGGGKDFAAFTTDIMHLAERAAATIGNFAAVYERLVATLKAADAKRDALDNTQNRTLAGLTERLEASLRAAALQRRQSVAASGEIGQLFGRISAGIALVIMELQIGDITRQRIEHVEEVLASLLEPAARLAVMPGEDTAIIAAVCRLQSTQMEQAAQDFEQGAVRVVEIIRQLGSDTDEIVAQSRQIHEESVRAGTTALAGLTEEVRRACLLMRECQAARAELDRASAAVNTSLGDLVHCVRSVQNIKGEMHILGINMGLKCAHLGAEGGALNVISHELRELAEKTVVHAQKAVEDLDEASGHARALKATATETALGDIDALEAEVHRFATMPQIDRGLADALDLLVREGTQVASLLSKAAGHTRFHEEIGSTLRAVIIAINGILAQAHALHRATGSGDANLAEEAAFAQLKGRYTMASERALHDQLAGLPSNLGAAQPAVSSAAECDLDDFFL